MKPKIKAWINQIESGQIKADGARILKYVKTNPYCTIREVSNRTGVMYSTVSARVSDLMDEGIIEQGGRMGYDNIKFTCLRFQPNLEKQKQNARDRKNEKMKQWIQKGMGLFSDDLPESLVKELELLTL